jgi:hypothetical protein
VIGAGLPASAEEWPDGVLERLKDFRQGDLVALPTMAYLTDPGSPIWEESRRFAAELAAAGEVLDPDVIHFPESVAPPYGMITTQTCDIVEEDTASPVWPWVQLVPVYDMDGELNSGQKRQLRAGQGWRRLLHVPAVTPGFHVADFRLSFPVEKGWLVSQTRIDGFGTEELRQRVGDRLALLAARPAFAGSFVETVQKPLTSALKDLKQTNRELFNQINEAVPEVGVLLDSRLTPSTVQVVVLCNTPLDGVQAAWWNTWWDSCRENAVAAGITLQALDLKVLDESYPAVEYRRLTRLPLVNLSAD